LYEAPADESGGEMMESPEDVSAWLRADCQPAEAAEPSQGALNHQTMVSQGLAVLNAAPGDPVTDPSPAQGTTTARQVMDFVIVELCRALVGPPRP
jgi:hypothetical protein